MSKNGKLNDNHFLSSLPLMEMTNAKDLDPLKVLESIFVFASVEELKEMLQNLCGAAMAEEYAWTEGPPGNLLFSAEKLEQLIEACYLINLNRDLYSGKIRKSHKKRRLLGRLSEEEMNHPTLVIKSFFEFFSLPDWKLALRAWLEAALSKHSVVESINPKELLPFPKWLEKLTEAAYWIVTRSSR